MRFEYKLTRLPDLSDGRINWSWGPVDKSNKPNALITWDWNWIRQEAAKLKVGESKIYNELF